MCVLLLQLNNSWTHSNFWYFTFSGKNIKIWPPRKIWTSLKKSSIFTLALLSICYVADQSIGQLNVELVHIIWMKNSLEWPVNCTRESIFPHLPSCITVVALHLQGVSWTTVCYMIGEVQYGSRVTDDYDKRLLNTYAKVWFHEEMFSDNFEFYTGQSSLISRLNFVETYRNIGAQ